MCGHAVTTGVMMMGAILAAWTDATFNLVGYTAVFINNIFTALYLVLMKNIKGLKDTSTVGEQHRSMRSPFADQIGISVRQS